MKTGLCVKRSPCARVSVYKGVCLKGLCEDGSLCKRGSA